MENFEELIKFYQKENERGYIYFNNELIEFKEFYGIFKSMNLETILEQDEQTWYLLMNNGIWHKASVKSEEEGLEQLELMIVQ